jgi:cytochrome P450
MKHFLEDYHSAKPKAYFNKNILHADSQLIMIAGTDTIASVLSFAFYYIARDASLQERLRQEISAKFGETIPGEFAHQELAGLPLLNAVIDETMRMDNPTCNSGARNVPPEGITIEGRYIPGGTTIFTGIDAHHRSKVLTTGLNEVQADSRRSEILQATQRVHSRAVDDVAGSDH